MKTTEAAYAPSVAAPPDVATSRKRLLASLADARDITVIRSFGNIGDQLIYAGMRRLLAGVSYREVGLRQMEGVRGELAVVSGGGAWCGPHSHMLHYLPQIEAQFERVVVFPSSFDVNEAAVRQALTQSKALFFARELVSYEQIRALCRADLAHDTAFFFDYSPYQHAGRGLLTAYRTDAEAAGHAIPPGNDDISATCESLDEWLWLIARHATVETDRAHVLIAAALLGKRVYYRASRYHKVPAIAACALSGYNIAPLGESRYDLIKEQLLGEARALATRLPADFVARHQQLALTVVMLSHGRLAQTRAAIRALQEHVRVPFKLLLLDNNSGASVRQELAAISRTDARIDLILLDENLGCAGGRDLALTRVTTPYALLLDNDVEVMPGAVEHLLRAAEQQPQARAVMGKVVFPDGGLHLCGGDYRVEDGVLQVELLGFRRRFDEPVGASGPCRWVSGTMTLVRTAALREHPYDLGLRHYYEDLEWCYRLNEAGLGEGAFYRCVEALGLHDHEPKTPDGALPVTERRRQALKYVSTIAHFYRQHAVIIPNLFDFIPELKTADEQFNLPAARLLLALVNAYGEEWALAQWEAGALAPLFHAPPIDAAALQAERDARQYEAQTQALAASRAEIAALTEQVTARERAWQETQAQAAARERELETVFNTRALRAVKLYWRARHALRRMARRDQEPGAPRY